MKKILITLALVFGTISIALSQNGRSEPGASTSGATGGTSTLVDNTDGTYTLTTADANTLLLKDETTEFNFNPANVGTAAAAGKVLAVSSTGDALYYVDNSGNWAGPVATNSTATGITSGDVGNPATAPLAVDPATGDVFYEDGSGNWAALPTGNATDELDVEDINITSGPTYDISALVSTRQLVAVYNQSGADLTVTNLIGGASDVIPDDEYRLYGSPDNGTTRMPWVDGDVSPTNEVNTTFQVNGSNLEITDASGTLQVALSSINDTELEVIGVAQADGNYTLPGDYTGDASALFIVKTDAGNLNVQGLGNAVTTRTLQPSHPVLVVKQPDNTWDAIEEFADYISVTATGNLTSTDVQSALVEIQTEVDGFAAGVWGHYSSFGPTVDLDVTATGGEKYVSLRAFLGNITVTNLAGADVQINQDDIAFFYDDSGTWRTFRPTIVDEWDFANMSTGSDLDITTVSTSQVYLAVRNSNATTQNITNTALGSIAIAPDEVKFFYYNGSDWTTTAPGDTNTDSQTLSIANDTLNISGATSPVDLKPYKEFDLVPIFNNYNIASDYTGTGTHLIITNNGLGNFTISGCIPNVTLESGGSIMASYDGFSWRLAGDQQNRNEIDFVEYNATVDFNVSGIVLSSDERGAIVANTSGSDITISGLVGADVVVPAGEATTIFTIDDGTTWRAFRPTFTETAQVIAAANDTITLTGQSGIVDLVPYKEFDIVPIFNNYNVSTDYTGSGTHLVITNNGLGNFTVSGIIPNVVLETNGTIMAHYDGFSWRLSGDQENRNEIDFAEQTVTSNYDVSTTVLTSDERGTIIANTSGGDVTISGLVGSDVTLPAGEARAFYTVDDGTTWRTNRFTETAQTLSISDDTLNISSATTPIDLKPYISALGAATQIPFINSGADDFTYSSDFVFDDTNKDLTVSGDQDGVTQVIVDNPNTGASAEAGYSATSDVASVGLKALSSTDATWPGSAVLEATPGANGLRVSVSTFDDIEWYINNNKYMELEPDGDYIHTAASARFEGNLTVGTTSHLGFPLYVNGDDVTFNTVSGNGSIATPTRSGIHLTGSNGTLDFVTLKAVARRSNVFYTDFEISLYDNTNTFITPYVFSYNLFSVDADISTTGNLTVTGEAEIGGIGIITGTGSPEGVLTETRRGSLFIDTNTGDHYRKTTTSGNTGWVLSN